MFLPSWYVHVTCTWTTSVSCMPISDSFRFRSCACAFSLGATHSSFSFHTQRGQLTDSACIARNKKRIASRLARNIRSQPVINTGHYQRFKHPLRDALSTNRTVNRNSETVWGIHEWMFKTMIPSNVWTKRGPLKALDTFTKLSKTSLITWCISTYS